MAKKSSYQKIKDQNKELEINISELKQQLYEIADENNPNHFMTLTKWRSICRMSKDFEKAVWSGNSSFNNQ
jgi:hypothetical protein